MSAGGSQLTKTVVGVVSLTTTTVRFVTKPGAESEDL